MEWTAFSHPGVLLPALATLVAIIFWFARLEGGQRQIVTAREEDKAERDARLEKIEARLDAHRENAEIHFNLQLHQAIERRQDDRFKRIEGRLGHIEEKLDDLLKR